MEALTMGRHAAGPVDAPRRVDNPVWLRRSDWIRHAEPREDGITRILFVCTGNVCRSAYGEARLRTLLGERRDVLVESAGIGALVGEPADPTIARLAAQRGVDMTGHRSRQLTGRMLQRADAVLTFGPEHGEWIARHAPEFLSKVVPLKLALLRDETGRLLPADGAKPVVGVRGQLRTALDSEPWIADPYRRSEDRYVEALDDIDRVMNDRRGGAVIRDAHREVNGTSRDRSRNG